MKYGAAHKITTIGLGSVFAFASSGCVIERPKPRVIEPDYKYEGDLEDYYPLEFDDREIEDTHFKVA